MFIIPFSRFPLTLPSQGLVFINNDKELRDPVEKEWAKCRNCGMNEDLGKADYVFSDKTGTLTANEMQLRLIAIKGTVFGNIDWRYDKAAGFNPMVIQ